MTKQTFQTKNVVTNPLQAKEQILFSMWNSENINGDSDEFGMSIFFGKYISAQEKLVNYQRVFVASSFVALHFSGTWSIKEATEDDFIMDNAYWIAPMYEQHDELAETNFNVIFKLENFIFNENIYRKLLIALHDKYPQANIDGLKPLKILKASGGKNADHIILENELPTYIVEDLIRDATDFITH